MSLLDMYLGTNAARDADPVYSRHALGCEVAQREALRRGFRHVSKSSSNFHALGNQALAGSTSALWARARAFGSPVSQHLIAGMSQEQPALSLSPGAHNRAVPPEWGGEVGPRRRDGADTHDIGQLPSIVIGPAKAGTTGASRNSTDSPWGAPALPVLAVPIRRRPSARSRIPIGHCRPIPAGPQGAKAAHRGAFRL